MFDYRLSPKEIDLLTKICREERSIKELSRNISISYSRTSELLTRLRNKGFLIKRGSLKKTIRIAKAEHAQRFCELTTVFSHIDWKNLLSHSKAEILTQICFSKTKIQGLSDLTTKTERTIKNNLKKPKEIGLIEEENKKFKITERFSPCCSFLKSWRYFYHSSLKDEVKPSSAIILQRGLEFIIESESPIENKNFVETGPSLLSNLDDELIYTSNTYIYTKRELSLKDHLKNALRIEPDNERISDAVDRIAKAENISIDIKEV